MTSLFDPVRLGNCELKNRIIMAPLTRGRAGEDGVPNALMAEYYRQRAGAGLIIAEATAVSPDGHGWLNSPGIYNDAQLAGWKKTTDAVHGAGGAIFRQRWHMGAAVHPDFMAEAQPVSASSVTLTGQLPTPRGRDRQFVAPRPLSIEEIDDQVQNFATAARRAVAAGMDGVEIHAANGFLIDQFTRDSTNHREDRYGGSIENRLRFMLEVVEAVCAEIGAARVGIRLSPTNKVWQIKDSDPTAVFVQAVTRLNAFGLAYVHLLEPKLNSGHPMETVAYLTPLLREKYQGKLIINGGFDQPSGNVALANQEADAIAFGTPFIANPDLPNRMRQQVPLADPDSSTFYTPTAQGYTDYPAMSSVEIKREPCLV